MVTFVELNRRGRESQINLIQLFNAETQLGFPHPLPVIGDLDGQGMVARWDLGAFGGEALGADGGAPLANPVGDINLHPAI